MGKRRQAKGSIDYDPFVILADLVQAAFKANPGEIAGIILEPVPGNAGLYLPQPGYLQALRQITESEGSLLIFDEVMTGFRLAFGGAQERFGIKPDLSCFGKIIAVFVAPPFAAR